MPPDKDSLFHIIMTLKNLNMNNLKEMPEGNAGIAIQYLITDTLLGQKTHIQYNHNDGVV